MYIEKSLLFIARACPFPAYQHEGKRYSYRYRWIWIFMTLKLRKQILSQFFFLLLVMSDLLPARVTWLILMYKTTIARDVIR